MNHYFSFNLPPIPSDTTLCFTTPSNSMEPPKPFPFFSSSLNDDVSTDNSTSSNLNYTNDVRSETASSSHLSQSHRDHMFEKPLTPSDVGKLNRLVIPKQHAERYFPVAGNSAGDNSCAGTGGGVLLGFQDESGKCWQFRYSYWNSSQSYVLTKGWSRFVKEKRLDAGDVVLFDRHRFDPDRFFIGWRRRSSTPAQSRLIGDDFRAGWTGGGQTSSFYNAVVRPQQQQSYAAPQRIAALPYQPDCPQAGTDIRHQNNRKAVKSGGNSKRLRLFGVNLECQLEDDGIDDDGDDDVEEPQTSDGSSLSSQGQGQGLGHGSGVGPTAYNYFDYVGYPPNHRTHMDMKFPQDVNQMRDRLG